MEHYVKFAQNHRKFADKSLKFGGEQLPRYGHFPLRTAIGGAFRAKRGYREPERVSNYAGGFGKAVWLLSASSFGPTL
jgi:hypothetical protein